MSHPLDGCWAKIERANHNINRLNQLVASFVSIHGHDCRADINTDFTEHIYRVHGPTAPPLEFAVRTGEIISHLRSSLDHLAWALVLARHKSPTFKVQFPIHTSIAKYKDAINRGTTKRVSGHAQTLIEKVQPYHTANPAADSLTILHDLNNIDKHKLLLVVACYTGISNKIHLSGPDVPQPYELKIIPEVWSNRMIRAEENGAEIFRIRFTRPAPKVSMYAELTQQIAFAEFGIRKIEPLIPGLTSLRDAVIKTISLFEGEF